MSETPICSECKREIEWFGEYYKHDDTGMILCKKCFNKLVKKGKIV